MPHTTHRAEGLRGRDFRLLLLATLGTFANYAALLSVVPLWSAEGGEAYSGVGAATGVTMAATVAVQLGMGRLMRRFSLRGLLASGAALLGLPTFAYPLSSQLAWVLGVSGVRGAGFGIVAVAGSALVAELVPAGLRGRAVGRYGLAVGLPHLVLLPAGVWAAEHLGFAAVFTATGALCVLTVPLALAMSRPPSASSPAPEADGPAPAAPYRGLLVPWLLLLAAAFALGGLTSFLPLSLPSAATAPVALSVLFTASVLGRWAAGWLSDRRGAGRLLTPSVLLCALGMALFAASATGTGGTAGVCAAAVLFGLGFGALQNDTLLVLFHRAGPRGHGRASAVWNTAYDGGTGAGSLGTGLAAQALGFPGAFLAAAVLGAVTLPWALRERRRVLASHHTGTARTGGPAGSAEQRPAQGREACDVSE